MHKFNEALFAVLAIVNVAIARIENTITSVQQQHNDSNLLCVAKTIYNDKSTKKESKQATADDYNKQSKEEILFEYSKIMLLLAISAQSAVKHNLAARSNLIVEKMIKSVIAKLVSFNFSEMFRHGGNINRNLIQEVRKKMKVEQTVPLSNNAGVMVVR